MVMKVLNKIEEHYIILACYMFIKGKENFRKTLYSEYKANRPTPNPVVYKLYEYAKVAHNMIESNNCEAEDMVFSLSKKIEHNGLIVYIDHDLEEIPSLMYNYGKDTWKRINEKQAKWNFYKKLNINEPGDNVQLTKGCGIKWFEKNNNIDFTIEEYRKALFNTYLKVWKDENIAKEKMELGRKLLSLWDIDSKEFKDLLNSVNL